ncbi:syndetin-like isoform X1 [Panonychus citri]|uniref:syndetin-like isoform X1 n=1 Tax=Panonychus citri TaxID=50023 RepID=UPI002307C454|nr:syndetin-like isoform X1 [Panonychus citri]
MDSLCMHFATAISDKAFGVVHGYVELCSVEVKKIDNFRKKEYKELCKYVTNECFIPCLIDLSKSLFNILLNYKRILYFHQCEIDSNNANTINLNNINNNEDHLPHESEQNSKCQPLDTGNEGGISGYGDEGEERSIAAATITTNSIINSDKGDTSDIEDDTGCDGGGPEAVNGNSADETIGEIEEEEDQVEADFNRRFILQKLEHGLGRIWQEAQQKLRLLVQSHDMSTCSFEELMTILRISRRMMDIGSEFCDNNSTEFEETLHAKTVNYFNHYHKTRLDELRMYLENESWTVCPVKNGFQCFDLQEFKFLKPLRTYSLGNLSLAASETSGPPGQGSPEKCNFFRDSLLNDSSGAIENPFDNICLENEDASDSIIRELERTTNKGGGGDDTSEDELDDEMTLDSNKTTTTTNCGDNDKRVNNCYNEGPLVTNTSLYVVRLIGKYMQIMFLLRQIAFDILLSIFHLFDYYFYTVYTFFAKEISEVRNNCLSLRFKSCLARIESSMKTDLINETNDLDQHPSTIQSMGLMDRNLCPENLHGLAERIVGIESVMFLASQLNTLQQFFRDLIPSGKHSILDKYYSQAVSVAQDLRYPCYMLVAIRSINIESILSTVENVRWDLTEIPTMHNSYVDCLLKEIQLFSYRLEKICSSLEAKIPQEAKDMLWSSVLKLANRTFVEGYSMAKKCTPAGRALMQLDYQEFLTKAEKMTAIKPIPERELVEEYIKAYYLMDDALEQWLMSRNEYTQRQLVSLVNCIASEKRVKTRLLAIIENKFDNQNCPNSTNNETRH